MLRVAYPRQIASLLCFIGIYSMLYIFSLVLAIALGVPAPAIVITHGFAIPPLTILYSLFHHRSLGFAAAIAMSLWVVALATPGYTLALLFDHHHG